MAGSKELCKIVFKNDARLGWVAVVSGECSGLNQVVESQLPARRRYLNRRIIRS